MSHCQQRVKARQMKNFGELFERKQPEGILQREVLLYMQIWARNYNKFRQPEGESLAKTRLLTNAEVSARHADLELFGVSPERYSEISSIRFYNEELLGYPDGTVKNNATAYSEYLPFKADISTMETMQDAQFPIPDEMLKLYEMNGLIEKDGEKNY